MKLLKNSLLAITISLATTMTVVAEESFDKDAGGIIRNVPEEQIGRKPTGLSHDARNRQLSTYIDENGLPHNAILMTEMEAALVQNQLEDRSYTISKLASEKFGMEEKLLKKLKNEFTSGEFRFTSLVVRGDGTYLYNGVVYTETSAYSRTYLCYTEEREGCGSDLFPDDMGVSIKRSTKTGDVISESYVEAKNTDKLLKF